MFFTYQNITLKVSKGSFFSNLVPRVFRLLTRGSGRRKTLVQAGHVPPKKWEVTKKQ